MKNTTINNFKVYCNYLRNYCDICKGRFIYHIMCYVLKNNDIFSDADLKVFMVFLRLLTVCKEPQKEAVSNMINGILNIKGVARVEIHTIDGLGLLRKEDMN